MNSGADLERLRSRKHALEDLIARIVGRPRRLTPQVKQLLQGYKDELADVRQAIAMHAARAS